MWSCLKILKQLEAVDLKADKARGTALPYQLTLKLPYVLTLLVLALATGRSRAPGNLGQAYEREAH